MMITSLLAKALLHLLHVGSHDSIIPKSYHHKLINCEDP